MRIVQHDKLPEAGRLAGDVVWLGVTSLAFVGLSALFWLRRVVLPW